MDPKLLALAVFLVGWLCGATFRPRSQRNGEGKEREKRKGGNFMKQTALSGPPGPVRPTGTEKQGVPAQPEMTRAEALDNAAKVAEAPVEKLKKFGLVTDEEDLEWIEAHSTNLALDAILRQNTITD